MGDATIAFPVIGGQVRLADIDRTPALESAP